MNRKKVWAVFGLLLMCVTVMFTACKKDVDTSAKPKKEITNETYRNVKVLEAEGDVSLIRNKKEMNVYPKQVIKGGDRIVTAVNSIVDFQLDDDKYAKLSEKSEAKFELTGDAKKGAIRIYLSKGAIYNEIENPLSEDDSYEIHTPDGVMAVRGTVFEVVILDNEGKRETHVITHEGTVNVKVSNSSGEEVDVNAGEEIIIDEGEQGAGGELGEPSIRQEETAEPEPEPTTPTPPPSTNNKPATPTIQCPVCKNTVSSVSQHKATCNVSGHYTCDGKKHSACLTCNQLICNSADHVLRECGIHYPCDDEKYAYDGHEKMACGHYMCALAENPEMPHGDKCVTCGEMACYSSRAHTWSELCGCLYCGTAPTTGHGEFCTICGTCLGNGRQHGEGLCGNN